MKSRIFIIMGLVMRELIEKLLTFLFAKWILWKKYKEFHYENE